MSLASIPLFYLVLFLSESHLAPPTLGVVLADADGVCQGDMDVDGSYHGHQIKDFVGC